MSKFSVAFKIRAKNGLLQDFIEKQGWTQADFARAIGVTQGTMGAYFNLQQIPRNPEVIKKIEEVTGYLIEDLFPEILKSQVFQERNRPVTVYREIDTEFLPHNKIEQIGYTPDDPVEHSDLQGQIEKVLAILTPREQKVIEMRFGLNGYEEKTLDEAAEAVGGVTRERLRQIEFKALRKIRHPLSTKRLMEYTVDTVNMED